MKYKFPEIRDINDVLPHIEGRGEFIVAERPLFDVINYMVAFTETFDMPDVNDLGAAIRRECRGLIFDKSGKLISRPFHKFFNVGERVDTQIENINLNAIHVLMEKMDGSMIRPLVLDNVLQLGTKMGVTDIANEAKKLLTEIQSEWLYEMFFMGKTPLFEYISPTNKIVIQYGEPKLILLGVRDNLTGVYSLPSNSPFETVKVYGSMQGNLDEYIARARLLEGREGDIIRFADGHMVKMKNDWYVRIHKTKDMIQTERHILNIIMSQELDDLLPILDEEDVKTVKDYEKRFEFALEDTIARIEGLALIAKTLYGNDKKRVALEFNPNLISRQDGSFIFGIMDGKDLRTEVMGFIKKNLTKTVTYDKMSKWMGDI